jgi:phage-related protein
VKITADFSDQSRTKSKPDCATPLVPVEYQVWFSRQNMSKLQLSESQGQDGWLICNRRLTKSMYFWQYNDNAIYFHGQRRKSIDDTTW